MTMDALLKSCGVSDRLVSDFIKPTLLVGLFKPPEELSAAVACELLYYYALAHQTSFDVRWMRRGTVASTLIAPLAESLKNKFGEAALKVVGGASVSEIVVPDSGKDTAKSSIITEMNVVTAGGTKATGVRYTSGGQSKTLSDLDGVVLAVGSTGMKAIVGGSPGLARTDVFARAASLSAITVVSVRIWLDGRCQRIWPIGIQCKVV